MGVCVWVMYNVEGIKGGKHVGRDTCLGDETGPMHIHIGFNQTQQLLHVDHAGHSCTGLTVPSLSLSHMLRVHKLWAWANEPTG